MNKSDLINELTTALAKAQGAIENAKKDSANPFYKSTYADLASVWDVCRKPLSDNGLSVTQLVSQGEGTQILETVLFHASGQWLSSVLTLRPKDDSPQAIGSAITYARRYALSAIVGVAAEDDDGEQAQGRDKPKPQAVFVKTPPAVSHPPVKGTVSSPAKNAQDKADVWGEHDTRLHDAAREAAKPKPVPVVPPSGAGPSPSPIATPGASSLPAATSEAAPTVDIEDLGRDETPVEHALPEVADINAFWKAAKLVCAHGMSDAVPEALGGVPLADYLRGGGTLAGALKALQTFKGVTA